MTTADSLTICTEPKIESPAGIPSRYEVLSQIGSGGMGIVYKVLDLETDEVIALKILKSDIASDPTMQENLRREVYLARKVTHKNVCRIHEFNRSSGMAYISMEFVEGESLLSKLQRSGPLPWNEAVQIARQICSGLREAHAQGIVHRDLKPANIMVGRNGWVKIMDFGIARSFQGTVHMTGTLVGTPAYMAPEQVELKRVDARTDVYAMGLLLYEIVTGSPAFEGETPIAVAVKQLREFPKRPREIITTLPTHAEAVILKCLQKDPAKRFQSVDELAAALTKGELRSKPAVSLWASFVVDFRRAARDLHRSLQPSIAASGAFLRRQNWRACTTKRVRLTAGSLGVACLLSGFVVISARRGPINHMPRPTSVNVSLQSGPYSEQGISSSDRIRTTPQTLQPVVSGSPFNGDASPIGSYEVDLGSPSEATADKDSSLNQGSANQQVPETKASRAEQKAKTQPGTRSAASSMTARRATSPSPVAQGRSQEPDDAAATTSLNGEGSTWRKTDLPSDLSASVLPATQPSAPTDSAASENATEGSPVLPGRYFEVGSFKDSTWANHAVEKLTQLGFHAVSVHKNLLWMQSYQVRVGPYADAQDLEAAREVLASQGFKPHVVK